MHYQKFEKNYPVLLIQRLRKEYNKVQIYKTYYNEIIKKIITISPLNSNNTTFNINDTQQTSDLRKI